MLLAKWQKKGTVLYRLALCHLAFEQPYLSRFHNKLLQMLASIPAYSWAKQGWQVDCKVSCRATLDGAVTAGGGGKAWLTACPEVQLPSGHLPVSADVFQLARLAAFRS